MLRLDPTPQIWGITGNLGGGKTLTAVCLAVNAIKRGYFVVSNVTLNMDAISRVHGEWTRNLYQHFSFDSDDFDPFKLPTGSPRGSNGGKRVLVILDECAEWVDQYSTAKDPRIARFWSWLRHSSKRSQDVILIVQRLEYLNKVLRLLVAKWVIVDDLKTWRMPLLKIRAPFMSGWCMQRVFDRNKRLVQGPCIVRKSEWGRYYNTAECLNSTGASLNYEYEIPKKRSSAFSFAIFVLLASSLLSIILMSASNSKLAQSRSWFAALARNPPSPVAQQPRPHVERDKASSTANADPPRSRVGSSDGGRRAFRETGARSAGNGSDGFEIHEEKSPGASALPCLVIP